jgi:hypothetical protein
MPRSYRLAQWRTQEFCSGGGSTNSVEDRENLSSFRILLPFFCIFWGVGVLNSAIFNSFHNRGEFGTILEGLWNFRGV